MHVLYFFSRQNLKTFDMSYAILPLTFAKVSTLKNSPVFWPNLYYQHLFKPIGCL